MKQKTNMTTKQRINRIMDFYYKRGCNVERINNVLRNYLKIKYGEQEK